MKPILFIFLFSLICCRNTFEIFECLTKDGVIVDRVFKVIDSFKSEDYGQMVSTLLEAFFTIKDIVTTCLKEEEDEPILQIAKKGVYNPIALEKCKMMCGDYYYDYECNKRCNEEYGGDIIFNDPFDIINNNDF